MVFNGFQKMTLLDFPGKVACTLFTAGCNFRCPFCHNALLVTQTDNENVYTEEEILGFLKKRKGLLDGVAITGGEPLLHKDITDFILKVREMGFLVKLDTNGSFPEALGYILENRLVDYVAMDIKNRKSKYALTSGIQSLDISKIEKSISLLMNSPIEYEFRTTIVKEFHSVEDISVLSKEIKGAKHYYLQNFVDSGNLIDPNTHPVEKETLLKMLEEAKKNIPTSQIRGV